MGKYIDFYKKCMESGKIPHRHVDGNDGGLCGVLGSDTMDLFIPTHADCVEYNVSCYGYFASDNKYGSFFQRALDFGPTRQNIILFLAAMASEDFNELYEKD
jgi:hypothetical protein